MYLQIQIYVFGYLYVFVSLYISMYLSYLLDNLRTSKYVFHALFVININ